MENWDLLLQTPQEHRIRTSYGKPSRTSTPLRTVTAETRAHRAVGEHGICLRLYDDCTGACWGPPRYGWIRMGYACALRNGVVVGAWNHCCKKRATKQFSRTLPIARSLFWTAFVIPEVSGKLWHRQVRSRIRLAFEGVSPSVFHDDEPISLELFDSHVKKTEMMI